MTKTFYPIIARYILVINYKIIVEIIFELIRMVFVYKLIKIKFINYVLLNSIYNFTYKTNIYIIKILQQLSLVLIFYNNGVDNFFLFLIH